MLALFFAVFGVADAGGATGFVGGHAVAATSVFGITVAAVARVTVLCLIVAGAVVDSVVPTYVADVAAVGVFVPVFFWLFDLHLLAIMMAQKLRLEFQFIKNP